MREEPSYVASMRATIAGARIAVHGSAERWAAPVAIIDAPNGFGEEIWPVRVPVTTIAWHIGGGDVVSEMPGHRGKRAGAGAHTVNLQPRGVEARYRARDALRFCHFYISDPLLARVFEGLDRPGFTMSALRPDLIMFQDPELLARLDRYGRRTLDPHLPPSRVEMEALALLVVERLLVEHHPGRPAKALRGGLAPWQIRRACAAMEAQLDQDIGLDRLAEVAGCSPTHFSRAFRRSMGVPPFAWLLQRRIERAKALLTERRLSLAEVALAVGFSAQPQFTTAFRRVTGTTPGAWRRASSD